MMRFFYSTSYSIQSDSQDLTIADSRLLSNVPQYFQHALRRLFFCI
jgi:hypothetical protein